MFQVTAFSFFLFRFSDNKKRGCAQPGIDPKQLASTLEGIEEYESPCMSHSSSQQDYNTASASSGCSSPLSEPTSTSSDTHHRAKQAVSTATATATVSNRQPARIAPQRPSVSNRNRYGGSQGHLQTTSQETPPIRLTPSSSDYFKKQPPNSDSAVQQTRQHSTPPVPQPRGRSPHTSSNSEMHQSPNEHSRSQPRIEKQNSEKYEQKKRELSNQSNSFDDFLRMSRHAGVDDRQSSPSPSRTRASKRGISTSATELARTRGSESEDEIKKVSVQCFLQCS